MMMITHDVITDTEIRARFFQALQPDGYRDLRALRTNEPPKTVIVPAADLQAVEQFITQQHDRDLYVGIATRRDASSGALANCQTLFAVFVDLDFKTMTEAEARARIARFPHQPSLIIASGHGLHVYWILTEPISLPDEAVLAKACLRALASALGGDSASAEPAHILRVPGTWNHKYDPARPVVLEELHTDRQYPIDVFKALITPAAAPPTPPKTLPPTIPHGQQHDTLFREGCRLRRRGYAEAEIAAALWALHRNRSEGPDVQHEEKDIKTIAADICKRYLPGQAAFVTHTNGRIQQNHQGNIALAVDRCGVQLSYNLFSEQAFIEDPHGVHPLDDAAREDLWLRIDRDHGFRPTFFFFEKVVNHLARQQSFHPVKNYLESLVWDGEPRIDRWLAVYGGAEEPLRSDYDDSRSYLEAVSGIVLMAAVKRVLEPGCKYDEMVVLESPQGKNKSAALRALCPHDEWFSDDLSLNADSKVLIEHTLGKWIIEASDLAGKRKTEIEQLKATLSRQVDGPARMAYAHHPVQRRRHFIIIGTTNSAAYLTDATGARRFWPVRIRRFDVPALVRDRDRLWSEAVMRVKQGEAIRLPETLWSAAGVQQEARREIDPWEDTIRDALDKIEPSGDGKRRISAEDLFGDLALLVRDRDRTAQLRLSQIMQRLGFTRQAIWDPKTKRSAAGYIEDRLSGLAFEEDVGGHR